MVEEAFIQNLRVRQATVVVVANDLQPALCFAAP